jgi:hypothetical protein
MLTKVNDKNVFGKTVNVIFTNVLNYDLQRDECTLRYELRFRDPNRISVAIPDNVVSTGEWNVPSDILSSWSGSNHFLAEKMCEDFGFEVIEELQS